MMSSLIAILCHIEIHLVSLDLSGGSALGDTLRQGSRQRPPGREALPKRETTGAGQARALERGLRLLRCFDVEHPSWRIVELALATQLHPATTRRLAKTLEARSFLCLDRATGMYRLGPALLPMSYLAHSHDELVRVARPHMEQLAAQTEETVGLSVWTDGGIVQVEHIPTTRFFKPAMLLGEVTCKYGTSHSKIFLAFGPEERMSRLWFSGGGPGLTPDIAPRVREELQHVRETGVAYDIEERTNGVCALSVPVRDSTGESVASLAVIAPTDRFDPIRRESLAALARRVGAAMSEELGFREPQGSAKSNREGGHEQ